MINEVVIVTYTAWDTSANTPKTGDVANHTIKYIADGTEGTPAASPAEVGNGEYSIAIAADENTGTMMAVTGESATANIEIVKASWQNGGGATAANQTSILSRLSGMTVTTVSPLSSTGAITLHQWDDYYNAESRSLEWSSTGNWGGGSLASATIALRTRHAITGATWDKAGTVITSSGATQTVRVEISSTDTGAFSVGETYDYQLRATLSSTGTGHAQTLATGRLTVGDSLLGKST